MKITQASKKESKVSKVQQKLGIRNTGKVSKRDTKVKTKLKETAITQRALNGAQAISKINQIVTVSKDDVVTKKDKLKKEKKNQPKLNNRNDVSEETISVTETIPVKEKGKIEKGIKKEASVKTPLEIKPNVPDETIIKALGVIDRLNKNFLKKKNLLFAEDVPLLIQIDAIKIAQCTKRKLRFKLPHSLVTNTSDICIFVCDLKRGKKVDHEPTVQHYEDLLREKGVTNIKAVVPIRQVRVEYDQIEMKRRLLTQYDFFLADARVSGLLAHKLGSIFFNKNQLPTPLDMDAKDLKKEIDKALRKTVMRLHGEGTTFTIRVGNGQLTPQQVCENIQAVLLQASEQFPGGWFNVRSVHVKTQKSMAIPIYITLRKKNAVKRPVIEPLYETDEIVEGDLSTLMGASVQVYKSGKVIVKKTKKDKDESDNADEFTPIKKPKLDIVEFADKNNDKMKKKLSGEKKTQILKEDNNDEQNNTSDDETEEDESVDEAVIDEDSDDEVTEDETADDESESD